MAITLRSLLAFRNQILTSGSGGGGGTPSGPAGGQLSGTYPAPSVIGLTETSGPTALYYGSILNNQILVRSGATVIGMDWHDYDELVKVSAADDFGGYLNQKLAAGPGISYSILNPGGDEQYQVSVLFGSISGTAVEGNDPRVPTQNENDALQGTYGSPSNTNRYVTDTDPRLSGGGSGHTGTATLNFGPGGGGAGDLPQSSVVVTGQSWVTAGSIIDAWIRAEATPDHTVDEVVAENIQCFVGDFVVGVGFTIYGNVPEGSTWGDFYVNWSGN